MGTVLDAEYRRSKQNVVEEDRKKSIIEFVKRFGFPDGLEKLSKRTGQPVQLYRAIARSRGMQARIDRAVEEYEQHRS
jgi:hypothetical protein